MTDSEAKLQSMITRLNRTAARLDQHERAATELLIWHGFWLRRADFRKACVTDTGGSGVRIRWPQAGEFLDSNPRGSTSELKVLRIAVVLGDDRLGIRELGRAHKRAVAEAFATACDAVLEPPVPEVGHSHPDIIPCDPATCYRGALEAGKDGVRAG